MWTGGQVRGGGIDHLEARAQRSRFLELGPGLWTVDCGPTHVVLGEFG